MAPGLERYGELVARVDAFFRRVEARHGGEMQCRAGCTGCCRAGLTVTGVEAAAVRAALAALQPAARERLRARAAAAQAGAPGEARPAGCVALEPDGRCAIYPARPLVCRSHGLPLRLGQQAGLPVIQACSLNFTGPGGPEAADADCVLDQETLSTVLLAIDLEHAGATGRAAGERFDLLDLLAAVD